MFDLVRPINPQPRPRDSLSLSLCVCVTSTNYLVLQEKEDDGDGARERENKATWKPRCCQSVWQALAGRSRDVAWLPNMPSQAERLCVRRTLETAGWPVGGPPHPSARGTRTGRVPVINSGGNQSLGPWMRCKQMHTTTVIDTGTPTVRDTIHHQTNLGQ